MLVPFDAVVDTARSDLPNGAVQVVPHVTVRDVPAGYPVIVAVRRGPEPPPIPQMREVPVDGQGKPLRIHQTGSLIPEIELAPADSGHEITVRWPDRTREVVALPG
ncbi:hypothetical protein [Microbacterium elymi]|uniref:Uncharacterized protein n=1 Tax=Microbacterium elymi TaxID=2909587 RepID=A0ABY5NKJ2_9MICO|nr:hypothetical protein [Microbacterium elymi]UUT35639.1 hypothetical protein L2X98_20400 [Microbacterium elymi]